MESVEDQNCETQTGAELVNYVHDCMSRGDVDGILSVKDKILYYFMYFRKDICELLTLVYPTDYMWLVEVGHKVCPDEKNSVLFHFVNDKHDYQYFCELSSILLDKFVECNPLNDYPVMRMALMTQVFSVNPPNLELFVEKLFHSNVNRMTHVGNLVSMAAEGNNYDWILEHMDEIVVDVIYPKYDTLYEFSGMPLIMGFLWKKKINEPADPKLIEIVLRIIGKLSRDSITLNKKYRGYTPLFSAIGRSWPEEVVDSLLELGADPNLGTSLLDMPTLCAQTRNAGLVEKMIGYGMKATFQSFLCIVRQDSEMDLGDRVRITELFIRNMGDDVPVSSLAEMVGIYAPDDDVKTALMRLFD